MAVRFLYSKLSQTSEIPASLLVAFIPYQAIGFVVALVEGGMINLGSALGKLSYEEVVQGGASDSDSMLAVGLLSSILYITAARSSGLYRLPALIRPVRHLARIAAVCAFVLLALTAVLFVLKTGGSVSRGSVLGCAALMLMLSSITRLVAAGCIETLLSRNLIAGRPAVLVGEADELEPMTSAYLLRQFGLRDVARVAVDRMPGRGNARGSQVAEAARLARRLHATEFVVAVKGDEPESLNDISAGLRKSPLPVRLLPNRVFRTVISRNAAEGEASVYLIDLQRAPMSIGELCAKRVLDVVLSSFALLVLTPLFIASALAIKIDSAGPIIFKQRRNGFDENQFSIFKFRTMLVQEDGAKIVQARRGDSRVTRVGQFLRRTSIDELPQFLNVLKGDMSIVGPRPHALAHDDEYKMVIGDYYKRHHVKPGITGWAQINGFRGETALPKDMQDRIDCDVWYISNWSFMLDLTIMIRTCLEVVKHDAY